MIRITRIIGIVCAAVAIALTIAEVSRWITASILAVAIICFIISFFSSTRYFSKKEFDYEEEDD